jgi:hypothetical protein
MARYGETLGDCVRAGPFVGMQITDGPDGFGFMKLIGTYEAELHPVIEKLIELARYETVVNVGCAEGFYAVGLALRLPSVRVYAFDILKQARQLCAHNADQNGVGDRVKVGGACKCSDLASLVLPGKSTLIVMDCEGAEKDLLRPDLIPGLLDADILVECHDFLDDSITPEILERFRQSHDMSLIDEQPREFPNLCGMQGLSAIDKAVAIFESRAAPMHWVVLRSRAHAKQSVACSRRALYDVTNSVTHAIP